MTRSRSRILFALAVFLTVASARTGLAAAETGGNSSGDYDPVQVKEVARELARLFAARFPRVEGTLQEVLPNGTSSCSLSDPRSAFATQRFGVLGADFVSGQPRPKATFTLTFVDDRGGCGGKLSASSGFDEISDGDGIRSLPLQVAMNLLRAAPEIDPALARMLSDETRDSLRNQPAFDLKGEPLVRIGGRISGRSDHAILEMQATDTTGTVIQRWDLTRAFATKAPPPEPPPRAAAPPPPLPLLPPPAPVPARYPVPPDDDCLGRGANQFLAVCVTSVNPDPTKHGNIFLTRTQLSFTNKTGRRLHVMADARRQVCGAVLTDEAGTAYRSVTQYDAAEGIGYLPPCGISATNRNPFFADTFELVFGNGELVESGQSISRQFTFQTTDETRNPPFWNMDLALFVVPEPEPGSDKTIKEAGISLPKIRKR